MAHRTALVSVVCFGNMMVVCILCMCVILFVKSPTCTFCTLFKQSHQNAQWHKVSLKGADIPVIPAKKSFILYVRVIYVYTS